MTIKIATAECFTHGIIAREIHRYSQGYEGDFGPKYLDYLQNDTILLCGLFIPTLSSLISVLKVNPPEPQKLIKGIKVYDEETDKEVAVLMAQAVKHTTGADIGIGTTAGIGRGGIAIVTDDYKIELSSDIYADLTTSSSDLLLKRQESGIKKSLNILNVILDSKE